MVISKSTTDDIVKSRLEEFYDLAKVQPIKNKVFTDLWDTVDRLEIHHKSTKENK